MALIERYREWFEHELDCNTKMLGMLGSVPEASRADPRFQQALQLAAHLAACRENWLVRMTGVGSMGDWWPEPPALDSLAPRFAKVAEDWRSYLAGLDEANLAADFEFPVGADRYRWSIEGQIVQLVGHAFYHRGQIALLVKELGGQPVDTDYLYWEYARNPRFGKIEGG